MSIDEATTDGALTGVAAWAGAAGEVQPEDGGGEPASDDGGKSKLLHCGVSSFSSGVQAWVGYAFDRSQPEEPLVEVWFLRVHKVVLCAGDKRSSCALADDANDVVAQAHRRGTRKSQDETHVRRYSGHTSLFLLREHCGCW
jgi:hypothetical protein